MIAVILAGGKGTRLHPYTFSIPKPLLPLGEQPILTIVISQLAAFGFDRIVLTLGHMAGYFPSILGDGSKWHVDLEYFVEDHPLGTAGSLKLIPELSSDFLVINGDILTNMNFSHLMNFHLSQSAYATVAVTSRSVAIDFGVLTVGENNELLDYHEKPNISQLVSTGVNILSPECLDFIPSGQKFDMPELLMSVKKAGKTVHCYKFDDYWQDIGRLDDYRKADSDFTASPQNFLASCTE